MKTTETSAAKQERKRVYEKPRLVWEDDFKAIAYAPTLSCAKRPLQSGICDSRPTT